MLNVAVRRSVATRTTGAAITMATITMATVTVVAMACAAGTAAAATPGQDDAKKMTPREAAFAELLRGVTLEGSFTDDAAPPGQPLARDRYQIKKVTKIQDGLWRFYTTIEYSQRKFTLPLALPEQWAGETPVITMRDMPVPGLGTFSAHVLFEGDRYAGTWQGADHGGHLFGMIVRDDAPSGEDAPDRAPPAPTVHDLTSPHWPQYRGTFARGVAEGSELPLRWNMDTSEGGDEENVLWAIAIPGLCHSSPIVWDDLMFVTTAVAKNTQDAELKVGLYGSVDPVADEGEHEFRLLCIDKNDGLVLWDELCNETVPRTKRHPKGCHAGSTPATDGEYVVAFFGSEGLYCYNIDGERVWHKDLGVLDAGWYVDPDMQWGFSNSPVIHDGVLYLQVDVQGESYVAALDVASGDELWRTVRDEVPTWGAPTVDVREGRAQLICNGYRHMGGYDLVSGEELWKLSGGGDIPVPTPVVSGDLVYLTNAHGRLAPILAIDVAASGELTLEGRHLDRVETDEVHDHGRRRGLTEVGRDDLRRALAGCQHATRCAHPRDPRVARVEGGVGGHVEEARIVERRDHGEIGELAERPERQRSRREADGQERRRGRNDGGRRAARVRRLGEVERDDREHVSGIGDEHRRPAPGRVGKGGRRRPERRVGDVDACPGNARAGDLRRELAGPEICGQRQRGDGGGRRGGASRRLREHRELEDGRGVAQHVRVAEHVGREHRHGVDTGGQRARIDHERVGPDRDRVRRIPIEIELDRRDRDRVGHVCVDGEGEALNEGGTVAERELDGGTCRVHDDVEAEGVRGAVAVAIRRDRFESTARFSRSTPSARSRSSQRSGAAACSSRWASRSCSAVSSKTPPERVEALRQRRRLLLQLRRVDRATHRRLAHPSSPRWRRPASPTRMQVSPQTHGNQSPARV